VQVLRELVRDLQWRLLAARLWPWTSWEKW